MTRQLARTLTTGATLAALLLALPGAAHAQSSAPSPSPRVRIEATLPGDLGRELRDALRDVTSSIGEAMRDLARDLHRELGALDKETAINGAQLGRELSRGLAEGLRNLPDMARGGRKGDWDWSASQERNWNGKAEDRQSRTLAIGANGALELRNLSGDITVSVGSGRDATIELVRRARGRTEADARLGLERVKVETSVNGSRGVVRSDYPNDRQASYSVSVDMIVSVPVGTRVLVNSVSSDVKVSGVKGELSVTTVSGNVTISNVGAISDAKTASGDVTITGSTGDGALDAGTLSGDVTLQQVKARKITAGSVSGNVTARNIACDTATINSMSGDTIFEGSLAQGGRYEITNHSGDVRFTPSNNTGFTVSASSFNGSISSSFSLQGDGSRNRRNRSMNGKIGDGSATVTLKTFSGDITVGSKK